MAEMITRFAGRTGVAPTRSRTSERTGAMVVIPIPRADINGFRFIGGQARRTNPEWEGGGIGAGRLGMALAGTAQEHTRWLIEGGFAMRLGWSQGGCTMGTPSTGKRICEQCARRFPFAQHDSRQLIYCRFRRSEGSTANHAVSWGQEHVPSGYLGLAGGGIVNAMCRAFLRRSSLSVTSTPRSMPSPLIHAPEAHFLKAPPGKPSGKEKKPFLHEVVQKKRWISKK